MSLRRFGQSDEMTDAMRARTLALPYHMGTGIGSDHSPVTLDATTACMFDIDSTQVLSIDSAASTGDIVYASGSAPDYAFLNIGASGTYLRSDGASPGWSGIALGDVPAHDLLSGTHPDTVASSPTRGALVYGDSSASWARLNLGAQYAHLESDGTDVAWQANITLPDDAWAGAGAAGARWVFAASTAPDTLRSVDATVHLEGTQNALTAVGTPTNYHLMLYNPANDTGEGVGLGWYISQQTNDVGAAAVFVRNDDQTKGELRFYTKQNTTDGSPPTLVITLTDGGDLHFPTTGRGITHVDGNTAGYVLRADGTRYIPADPVATLPLAPVAQGDLIIADATPEWSILTLGAAAGYALVTTATTAAWDQTPTWTGAHTFNAGWLLGGGVADLNGTADALVLDADGDTTISAPVDDQIDIEINGANDFTFTANSFNVLTGSAILLNSGVIDMNGVADALILDANGDTTISAPVDNRIDIEIAGADDFTFTVNAFNVLTGSAIIMVDGTVIGVGAGAGAGRIFFDDTPVPDAISFLDCWVGIGTAGPSRLLEIYDADDDVYVRINTDKVDGIAALELFNDVQQWSIAVNTSDQFQIRDGTAPGNRLLIDTSGHVRPGGNKTQDLGLTGTRWRTLYQGTSTAAGTSRVFESTRDCPLCAARMVRGTGSLCILGEDRDYEVAHCPECGNLAVEEMKHLPSARLAERKPPPKIEFLGMDVFPMSGNSRKVQVCFRYVNGDEDGNGEVLNSTFLGETELADLMAMDEAARRAFLLELGRREWEALEEARLQEEEVAALQGSLDAMVAGLVGVDLLRQ